ncbi:acyl-CoA dehydrogenase [Arthrobacter sp. Soil782]|uniref:acyl-CoA dehydrogenase family protein n=1 Tax=Arthrobacter sp. Soil782 TaxID=1736410 RepID=UPI0006F913BE|nr:acyl-CoA dehydrogenase family protein [Arthrobacter sp. Soil782]KRF08740.1 acyl-CoA dehydrogenase [Arthrobacter sp. Soil782]
MSAEALQENVNERTSREVAESARETEWNRPSFAKGLYLGRCDISLIHPHPSSSHAGDDDGEEFLAQLTSLLTTMDGQRIEVNSQIPDEYLRDLAELGVFGIKIPKDYGGLGLSLAYYGRALMVLTSVHPSLGALVSAHQSIGVPEPVRMFGSDEQKQEYLPRCASGAISAFLLTEPDVGSDPARMNATATRNDNDGTYVLNGSKLWTTNGVIAELIVVMAKVPPHSGGRGGISAFVVEANAPGITVTHRNAFMGLRGIENGVTRFENVKIPIGNRLGREGQGLKIALTTLNTGRLSIPANCAAAGKWSLKIAREWSSERVQWGRPIGRHEAVAQKISFITATAFALESVFELSAALADSGQKDVRIEAALAKLWSSEMAYRIADELMQIRGGRGYESAASLKARGERAVPVEQQLRDLRINRIFEGSSEIMHLLIAREAVDAHLAAAGDLASSDADLKAKAKAAAGASSFYAGWLPHLLAGPGLSPRSYSDFGRLAKHVRYVERASRRLARHTFLGMARWQAKLEHRQVFLGRIVDIGAELFAMAATCSHAKHLEGQGRREAGELAEVFCRQARMRIEQLFTDLWKNTDNADMRLAGRVLDGRHTWLEEGVLDQSEGTGPWIADHPESTPGEENLHRKYR